MAFVYALPFFVFLALHHDAGAQNTCLTPNNRTGACIDIYNCPALIEVIRRSVPLTQEKREFLVRFQCGYNGTHPKVCCETQDSAPVPITQEPVTQTPVEQDAVTSTLAPETMYINPPDVSNHPNLRLLPEAICGPITTSKLLGSNVSSVAEFPWMALLAYDSGKPAREFRCGGTIINERYVLTAAHCVTNLPQGLSLVGVRLGEHDLRTERDCNYDHLGNEEFCVAGHQDYGVESVHSHPDFDTKKLQNDIALVRLDTNVDFSPLNIKPICLPIGGAATILSKYVIATGWGMTNEGIRSPVVKTMPVPQVPLDKCQSAYQNTSVQIWYKQMCTGGIKGKGTCAGDAGGPLQSPAMYKNNIKFVQHGIISYGIRTCGVEGFPEVNTKLVYYLDWVLNTMTE